MNESENNIPKLTGPRKSSAGQEIYWYKHIAKKEEERFQINNLTVERKELEKRQKPVSRKKETIQIRAKMNREEENNRKD